MLAPNSKHRALVTPAHRLKRVFNIDIERRDVCGKKMKFITCIEGPTAINKILDHLKKQIPATKNMPYQKAVHHHIAVCLRVNMEVLSVKGFATDCW